MEKLSRQKQGQKKYSDSVYAHYYKKGWVEPYPRTLIGDFVDYYPIRKAISLLPFSVKGRKVLSICCGDGFEGEFLYKLGAKVTVSDISEEAVQAAKRRCPGLNGIAADSENLPFKDYSFDLVLVRDGLHHLPHPKIGISEMNRVSKQGFVIIEAQKSFIMKILIRLGLALEYEVSGNHVYRFTRSEIRQMMQRFRIDNYAISTAWCYHVDYFSRKVYPALNNRVSLALFKLLFYTFNFVFGYFGNSMVIVANKDDNQV